MSAVERASVGGGRCGLSYLQMDPALVCFQQSGFSLGSNFLNSQSYLFYNAIHFLTCLLFARPNSEFRLLKCSFISVNERNHQESELE